MAIAELQFASGDESLEVRTFRVREAMNGLFEIAIEARSPNDDLDLESIVGKPAVFKMQPGYVKALSDERIWTGICNELELTKVEATGLSTYALGIVPMAWLLTQRTNYRLFQNIAIPEIVGTILDEWRVEHLWRIERDRYPKLELRIQYGESDWNFIARLLEEAGISYYFIDDAEKGSRLALGDAPTENDARKGPPLPFFDAPEAAQATGMEYLTGVRLGNRVRPGKLTIRDFDFRRPGFALYAGTGEREGVEGKLEQYHYQPGAFLTQGHKGGQTPVADDKGVGRHHFPAGEDLVHRRLHGHRHTKLQAHFKTNACDLSPGTVFQVAGHGHRQLAPENKLMVTSFQLEGEVGKEWTMHGSACFCGHPYKPHVVTKKPKVWGVQSAVVVGPAGETVHTDEFGRVRVQFHWDRQGKYDENSSVWLRVSQPWAGPGYGMINLPRVGHEVLVGFVEGDPDCPLIVGRLFNGAQQVPYKLPDTKLWSAWKTDSNSNIILFVDIPEHEAFCEQAEKERLNVVKEDEFHLIGGNLQKAIREDVGVAVGGNDERGIVGECSRISGGEYSITSRTTLSQAAGLELTMTSGYKWEAGVTPLLPFIIATLATAVIKQKIHDAFPAGPPDLMAILQAEAAKMGLNPNQSLKGIDVVVPIPAAAGPEVQQLLGDFKGLFKGVLQPLLAILGQLDWTTIQLIFKQLAKQPDLDSIIALLEKLVPKQQGGSSLGDLMNHLKDLFNTLLGALPDPKPAPGSEAPIQGDDAGEKALKKLKPVLEILAEIMDELAPGTSIRIEPMEIRITTGKASIELKGEDIEIKANGSIKIEGESVEISPNPCEG